MANQDDFAGSDPPFRNGQDQLGGTGAEHPSQGYSYVPDTAGGTALIYHITVAGKLVRNLRLSPLTITKIFTGKITNWDDPAITHDYGARLPSLPITPVIRSDGSGATYFFTRWMAHLYPSQWNAFCDRVHPGIRPPCGQTEFYPQFGNAKAENGSNNVVTFITSSYGNGSIGYDEYAYALNSHYPVVKVLNPGGYFVLPSASNVAVALTKAVINEDSHSPDFLQQNLDHVYTFKDPRSYPLSLPDRAAQRYPAPHEFQLPEGQDPQHLHQLHAVRRAATDGSAWLLTAARKPRAGRAFAERAHPRARGHPVPGVARQLPQPDHAQRAEHPAQGRAVPVAVRQARRAAELRGAPRQGHRHRGWRWKGYRRPSRLCRDVRRESQLRLKQRGHGTGRHHGGRRLGDGGAGQPGRQRP